MDVYFLFGIYVFLAAGIGLFIGGLKNRPIAGMIWGALLGPIGWLLVYFGPTAGQKKPARRANW